MALVRKPATMAGLKTKTTKAGPTQGTRSSTTAKQVMTKT